MSFWLHRFAGLVFVSVLSLGVEAPAGAQQPTDEATCRESDDTPLVIDACGALLDPYGKPVWALMRRAHALLDDGQIDAGRADAALAVRAAARNSEAHALLGRALRDAGEYEAALKSLGRSLSLDPENAAAYFYRAQLHYWRDEKPDALEDIGQAVGIDGGNLDFRYWRGVISDEAGDHETALSDFSWVISLDPENPEYLDSRAWSNYTLGRFAEALADIDRALSIDPDMATPHETRGHILFASNRRADAARELGLALQRDPERTLARQLLAWMQLSAPVEPVATFCGALPAVASRLTRTTVAVDPGPYRAGEPVTVRWKVPSVAIRPDQPAYLVAVLPEDVRFDGRDFLALAPGARGPFGMEYGAGEARAIVPLHVDGAPRSGVIEIVPYRAGPMPLEWQVVQISACGEKILLDGATGVEIAVEPGIPELVALDEATGTTPISEIRSLDGRFVVSEEADVVHVTEATTAAPVLSASGTAPVFSPSGRFLAVGSADAGVSDVYDLVAARKLGRFGPGRMYWSHGDSFLYVDRDDGRLQVVRTLHGDRYAPSAPVGADPAASRDDILTPSGAEGAVAGSEAWAFELSVEAGILGLANSFLENSGKMPAEDEEAVEGDLGAAAFHRDRDDLDITETALVVSLFDPGRTRRAMFKDELPLRLTAGYGIANPAPAGWNSHDMLWRTGPGAAGAADDLVRPVLLATQQKKPPRVASAAAGETAAFAVRASRPLPRADDNEAAAAAVADRHFGHLPGERLATLRAGRDKRWIDPAARDLGSWFPTSVAYFEPDETGAATVTAIPEPYPYWLPEAPASIDLNTPGRDIWTGAAGRERFWMIQSQVAGEAERTHSMALLSTQPGGMLRHADLLPMANMYAATRDRRTIGDEFAMRGAADAGDDWGEGTTVTLADGRYLTIVTRPVPHILVFDLQEWRLACAIARPRNPGNIGDAAFQADLRHVTQINRNGQVEVYDCATASHLLTGMYQDGEIVVVDKGGHYEGSREAAASVAVRIPGVPGRHLLAQFETRLAMPGLARRVLDGDGPAAMGAFDPPVLSVSSAGEGADARIDLSARSSAGLQSVDVFADGRLLSRTTPDGAAASVAVASVDIAGRGIVTAIATDRNGVTSAPLEFLPRQPEEERSASLYMLATGIDRYREIEDADLRYSAADATRMAKSITRSRLYSTLAIETLTDETATSAAILERIGRMVADAGPDDTILLSFAGHGLTADDGRVRLALTDTRLGDLSGTSLDFADVRNALGASRARIVVLLDICHGRLADRATIATNEEAVAALTGPGGPSVVVLSASRGAQYTEQTTSLSGGRLSVAIRDILIKDRAQADTDGNGNISLNEMSRAAMASVAHGSDGRQTPWVARSGLVGDFELF